MATTPERKDIALKRNMTMPSDYGQRAALALDRSFTGPHRDKAIARALNVSVRMAQYLRAGQHWTTERFNQASAAIENFDAYLASPDLFSRIDDLERELADIRNILRGEDDHK